jgi:dTDP-4-amino-4,6-dideoxygalactose transaminase
MRFFFLFAFLAVFIRPLSAQKINFPNNTKLVWSDEFDQGSSPDSSKWNYNIGTGEYGWGNNELQYVNEAFTTNWIAPLGPHVNAFEQGLQVETKTKHAAALSSGTSAIHLALILLGVQSGDTVFCQSITFSASANPIAYQGATPVFIDSEMDTWNMDPILLKTALQEAQENGKLPKAIIPVHLYGMPAKMNEINSIANEFGVPVIEDAAEALGANLNGKPCGSFGAFGVLSFNGNKIITTSGGGALLSNNEEMIEKARRRRHLGVNFTIIL